MASTAHYNGVTASLLHHFCGVRSREDVPVSKDWDLHLFLKHCDERPAGSARVVLLLGSGMEANGRNPCFACSLRGIEDSNVVIVNADTHLHGDGNRTRTTRGSTIGSQDHRGNDPLKQVFLPRNCSSPTLAGHLGDRATEVQVNVVRQAPLNQHSSGQAQCLGVRSVQLQRTHRIVLVRLYHVPRRLIALKKRPRRHHLIDK